jgi:hypothetical protein
MKAVVPPRARRPGTTAAVLFAVVAAVPSAAGDSPPDASVVRTRLPARLECGGTFAASITLLNAGATTWTSAHALAAVGGEDVFSAAARIAVPAGVEVAPGGRHTFRLVLTAPEIAVPQARTAWRMVDGDGVFFGETAGQAIAVECPPRIDDAEILETSLPARLACGETHAVRIAVRNTGSRAWSKADGYALGLVEGADEFHAPLRVALGEVEDVTPDAVHTFAATLVAPAAAGTYRLEWRMTRLAAGFFGPSVEQPVRVACAPRAAGDGRASR